MEDRGCQNFESYANIDKMRMADAACSAEENAKYYNVEVSGAKEFKKDFCPGITRRYSL